MNKSLVVAAAGCIVCMMPSSAIAQTLFGHGLRPCQDYLTAKKEDQLLSLSYETWILGFLSGVNRTLALVNGNDVIHDVDPRLAILRVQIECERAPDKALITAVEGVTAELMRESMQSTE